MKPILAIADFFSIFLSQSISYSADSIQLHPCDYYSREDACNISLESGYNLVILPVIPQETNIESILLPIITKVKNVWEFDPSDVDVPWKHYDLSSKHYSDLTQMTSAKAYWIEVSSDVILQVTGNPVSKDALIDIKQTLNSIDWPYQSAKDIVTALSASTTMSNKANFTKIKISPVIDQTGQNNSVDENAAVSYADDNSLYVQEEVIPAALMAKPVFRKSTTPDKASFAIDKMPNSSHTLLVNIPKKRSIRVALDIEAPVITITSPADNSLVNTPTITLEGTVDNEPFTETRTLIEGENTLTKESTDKAGNFSSSSVTITLDTKPPAIIITSPSDNSLVNTPEITLQGTIDGVSFTETRTLTEGENTLTKEAVDKAGNSSSASVTITLDTKPPAIIITQPTDNALVNTPTIALEGTIDGVSFSETRTLIEGENTLTKEAVDKAGNSSSASVTITLDTKPPAIIITSPSDNSLVNTPAIILEGTVDGVSFSETRTLMEGFNTLTKESVDAAGNTSSSSVTITLDTKPPAIIITSPADNSLVNTPEVTLQGTIDGESFSEQRTLTEG